MRNNSANRYGVSKFGPKPTIFCFSLAGPILSCHGLDFNQNIQKFAVLEWLLTLFIQELWHYALAAMYTRPGLPLLCELFVVLVPLLQLAPNTLHCQVHGLDFDQIFKIRGLGLILNLVFSGTVALCAGCNVYEAWAAVVVGAICGPLFLCCNWLLIHCQVSQVFLSE